MATKLYPIGMQTFSEIREEDFLYVDKTEYIYRMTHTSGKYFFLARPRRFGKSLLVSTMQSLITRSEYRCPGTASKVISSALCSRLPS